MFDNAILAKAQLLQSYMKFGIIPIFFLLLVAIKSTMKRRGKD